jgi:hypothetical protein
VPKFSASTALPYEHLERATAELGTELRRHMLAADVHAMPRWETFSVTGPREFTDLRGRTWYEYRATVESRPPFDPTTRVGALGNVSPESG